MERAWKLLNTGKLQKGIVQLLANPMIIRALKDIDEGFSDKTRKLPPNFPTDEKPEDYKFHPIEVMFYMMAFGYGVEQCAAGGLHDHAEDLKKKNWSLDRIRDEYTPLVGDIVWLVTKPEKGTWDQKNDGYLERLDKPDFKQFHCTEVDPEQIRKWGHAVCAADKCSNMRSSIRLARLGIPTEYYLKHGWKKNYERFAALRGIMDDTVHPLLLREYDATLARFRQAGELLESTLDAI